jgi:hypothetical protein
MMTPILFEIDLKKRRKATLIVGYHLFVGEVISLDAFCYISPLKHITYASQ